MLTSAAKSIVTFFSSFINANLNGCNLLKLRLSVGNRPNWMAHGLSFIWNLWWSRHIKWRRFYNVANWTGVWFQFYAESLWFSWCGHVYVICFGEMKRNHWLHWLVNSTTLQMQTTPISWFFPSTSIHLSSSLSRWNRDYGHETNCIHIENSLKQFYHSAEF